MLPDAYSDLLKTFDASCATQLQRLAEHSEREPHIVQVIGETYTDSDDHAIMVINSTSSIPQWVTLAEVRGVAPVDAWCRMDDIARQRQNDLTYAMFNSSRYSNTFSLQAPKQLEPLSTDQRTLGKCQR